MSAFRPHILTGVNSPRAATLEELVVGFAAACSGTFETQSDTHVALARAQELTPTEGIIVGTGSFSLIGGLRAELTSEDISSDASHTFCRGNEAMRDAPEESKDDAHA